MGVLSGLAMGTLSGLAIALIIHSLDHSLFAHLISTIIHTHQLI